MAFDCVHHKWENIYTTSFRENMTSFTTTPQPFYGRFSGTTRVSRCQKRNFWTLWCKGRLTEQTHRPSSWAPLHPDQPVPTFTIPPFFTGRIPFLPSNLQCQSTEGN